MKRNNIAFALSITIFVLIAMICFRVISVYNEYSYFKSKEFINEQFYLGQSLEAYFNTYCKYPDDGKEFLDFLLAGDLYRSQWGEQLSKEILRKGFIINLNEINSTLTLLLGENNDSDKIDTCYILITEVNLLNFYFSNRNIFIVKKQVENCCNWNPKRIKLFNNTFIQPNEFPELYLSLRKKIFEFNENNSEWKIPVSTSIQNNSSYCSLKWVDNNWEFSYLCNNLKDTSGQNELSDHIISFLLKPGTEGIINMIQLPIEKQ